jgi:hypothetical protein
MIRPRLWVADALLRLCFLKFRERPCDLIACGVLGTTMVRGSDGMNGAAGESADRNSDAYELAGSIGW